MIEMNKIHLGDAADLMGEVDDQSVDLIVTDPPYGIGFMNKDWDKALAPLEIWQHCFRALKPGAFAFVMSIPRQDCMSRMVIRLQDVGFRVDFTPIFWTFATGLPKAGNVGKLIDKRMGVQREVIGEYVWPDGKPRNTAIHKTKRNIYSDLKSGDEPNDRTIAAPATPEAKALDGSYCSFQPKPAVEMVLVAMKPLSEKTYIDQAMSNSKGITWLDSGRIPYNRYDSVFSPTGRFPANLLVSDDVLNDGRTISSKGGRPIERTISHFGAERESQGKRIDDIGSYSRYFSLDAWWEQRVKLLPEGVQKTFPFMVVGKPEKKEKNAGLEGMPKKQMYKCDNSPNSLELIGTTDGGRQPRENYHPTCKPIKLMSYLIIIGSRPGDIVLDPFVGSGTTVIAANLTGRNFIAMEIQKDYWEIATKRLDYARGLIV